MYMYPWLCCLLAFLKLTNCSNSINLPGLSTTPSIGQDNTDIIAPTSTPVMKSTAISSEDNSAFVAKIQETKIQETDMVTSEMNSEGFGLQPSETTIFQNNSVLSKNDESTSKGIQTSQTKPDSSSITAFEKSEEISGNISPSEWQMDNVIATSHILTAAPDVLQPSVTSSMFSLTAMESSIIEFGTNSPEIKISPTITTAMSPSGLMEELSSPIVQSSETSHNSSFPIQTSTSTDVLGMSFN